MADEAGEGITGASDVIQKSEEELEINDFPQPVCEMAVSKTRKEIVRILKEEMLRLASPTTYQVSRHGRYIT